MITTTFPPSGRPIRQKQPVIAEPPLTQADIDAIRLHNKLPLPDERFQTMCDQLRPSDAVTAAQMTPKDAIDKNNFGGVYFLFLAGELVYIGQSKHVSRRLMQHYYPELPRFRPVSDWFDAAAVLPVDDQWLFDVEALYMDMYQPIYNRAISRSPYLMAALVRARKAAKKGGKRGTVE